MKHLLLSVALLVALQIFVVEQARAYVISVDCTVNPSPDHIGIPKDNADCVYAWGAGGDPLVTKGSWEAVLSLFAVNIILDQVETTQFPFAQNTSPHAVFIKCANTVGFYHVAMLGRGWKFIYNIPLNPSNPGFWDDVLFASDAVDPYIATTVQCP